MRYTLALAALVALGGALFYEFRPRANHVSNPETVRAPKPLHSEPPIPLQREMMVRRDADYWPQAPHPIAMQYRVLIPSREFIDYPDVRADEATAWIAQFGGPLGPEEIENLRRGGIEVLLATTANAFHVRCSQLALSGAVKSAAPALLGWCRLPAEDRILPGVLSTLERNGGPWRVRVSVYPRMDLKTVAAALSAEGATVVLSDPPLSAQMRDVVRGIEVSIGAGAKNLERLAGVQGVYSLGLPQPTKRVTNEEAANRSNIPALQAAPRNLTGAGVTVLVRDEAQIFNHPDYDTRLVLGPDVIAEPASVHSTHVAGTIGGTGASDISAAARGMALGCTLISFNLLGDDVNEPLQAKTDFNAIISNHSYGFVTGWDNGTFNDNQSTFGTYSDFARNWDSIVHSDGLIMIKAAGNDRNDSGVGFPHDGTLAADGEYYNTVDSSSTGKNVLTVGATVDAAAAGVPSTAQMVLASSSSGPCIDGRLRPEIVANGDDVNSCNSSVSVGNEYTRLSGTSMACAVVTGATTMFLERYRQLHGSSATFSAHYLRAVYAQTATDLGRFGPDYLHGFGLLDIGAAVNLFEIDNASGVRIANRNLNAAAPERFFVINSDGLTPIKATLCWTDEAGDTLAGKALVNDLDLRIVRASDQAVFFPFTLNAANPEQPGSMSLNTVDTIEQVVIPAPAAGSYLIAVRSATLASPTDFTITSSHDMAETSPPVAVITSTNTTGNPPLTVNFDGTQSTDPDGSVVRYLWNFGDGVTSEGALLQHTYNAGSFTATLKVIDNQGASSSTSVIVAVANRSPEASITASPSIGDPPLSTLLSSLGSFDPDGQIVDFAWDFGDGTSGNGAQIAHTYMAPGLYYATLRITDNGNATDTNSTSVLVGKTLATNSARFNLNFQKPSYDKFTYLTKTFPVAEDYNINGLTGTIRIGNAQYGFRLDEKGRYKVAPLSVTLNTKRQQFKFTLTRAALVEGLAATGAVSRDIDDLIIRVPFAISLSNGQVLGSTGLPFSYSAKQGKTGKAKLLVP